MWYSHSLCYGRTSCVKAVGQLQAVHFQAQAPLLLCVDFIYNLPVNGQQAMILQVGVGF